MVPATGGQLVVTLAGWYKVKANSITLSWLQTGPKLVADRFEAGRRPAASWNLAYHLAR